MYIPLMDVPPVYLCISLLWSTCIYHSFVISTPCTYQYYWSCFRRNRCVHIMDHAWWLVLHHNCKNLCLVWLYKCVWVVKPSNCYPFGWPLPQPSVWYYPVSDPGRLAPYGVHISCYIIHPGGRGKDLTAETHYNSSLCWMCLRVRMEQSVVFVLLHISSGGVGNCGRSEKGEGRWQEGGRGV